MDNNIYRILKHPWLAITNLKERLFHRISNEYIEIIKNIRLFDSLNQAEFSHLLNSTSVIRYAANDLIFDEQEDACYIVANGSVRVYSIKNKEKIALACLQKGDYFGEQALIGQPDTCRKASIETITDTTLLRINKDEVQKILSRHDHIKEHLTRRRIKQILDDTIKIIGAYEHLHNYMKENDNNIVTFEKNQVIFKTDDPSDCVYIIMRGSVNVSINTNGNIKNVTIDNGHILGELGVVRNVSRSYTATAREHTMLFRIDKEDFKKYYQENPKLQKLLNVLSQVYSIPVRGAAYQSIDKINNITSVMTTFRLSGGRMVIATSTEHNYFVMKEIGKQGEIYSFNDGLNSKVEILVNNGFIVSINSYGAWPDVPNVCVYILDQVPVTKEVLDKFLNQGVIKLPRDENDEIICECLSLEKKTISGLIENGYNSLDKLSQQCGATTVCGSCRCKILDMLGQNLWISAVMSKSLQHNDYVISYDIKPSVGTVNTLVPGNHIVVQMLIEGRWIERPYTISDWGDKGKLRITIKNMGGVFTDWLFKNKIDTTVVRISQPQGNFRLITDSNDPVVCFAGGIGVTPFTTFAKALVESQPNRYMHVIYIVKKKEDFIFLDEFASIKQKMPGFKLTLCEKSNDTPITENEIAEFLRDYKDADVYICGPDGFEKCVLQSLQNINYQQDKIHLEKFTSATSKN